MSEPEKKHNLGSDVMANTFTYADYEGFLSKIYRSALPLYNSGDFDLLSSFANVNYCLNELCKKACGRSISRAVEKPLGSMAYPEEWSGVWLVLELMIAMDQFWQKFGLTTNKEDRSFVFAVNLARELADVFSELNLIDDYSLEFPEENGKPVFKFKIKDQEQICLPLENILNQNEFSIPLKFTKDLEDVFKSAIDLYGFGTAFAIFSEAGKIPKEDLESLTLAQWKEVYKVTPEGSEISRVAWEKIKTIISIQGEQNE